MTGTGFEGELQSYSFLTQQLLTVLSFCGGGINTSEEGRKVKFEVAVWTLFKFVCSNLPAKHFLCFPGQGKE